MKKPIDIAREIAREICEGMTFTGLDGPGVAPSRSHFEKLIAGKILPHLAAPPAPSKWIDIKPGMQTPGRKTKRWLVLPKGGGDNLGFIEWYSPWRKYAFYPNTGTLYEPTCLRDLANFCEQETKAHYAAAKEKKK